MTTAESCRRQQIQRISFPQTSSLVPDLLVPQIRSHPSAPAAAHHHLCFHRLRSLLVTATALSRFTQGPQSRQGAPEVLAPRRARRRRPWRTGSSSSAASRLARKRASCGSSAACSDDGTQIQRVWSGCAKLWHGSSSPAIPAPPCTRPPHRRGQDTPLLRRLPIFSLPLWLGLVQWINFRDPASDFASHFVGTDDRGGSLTGPDGALGGEALQLGHHGLKEPTAAAKRSCYLPIGACHKAERVVLWPQGWRHVLPPTPLKKMLRPVIHLALYLFDELLQQGRQGHAFSLVTEHGQADQHTSLHGFRPPHPGCV